MQKIDKIVVKNAIRSDVQKRAKIIRIVASNFGIV